MEVHVHDSQMCTNSHFSVSFITFTFVYVIKYWSKWVYNNIIIFYIVNYVESKQVLMFLPSACASELRDKYYNVTLKQSA